MNLHLDPNPYDPPLVAELTKPDPISGLLFGLLGVLIGLTPTLYTTYGLGCIWWELALMENPPTRIRPMGFAMSILLAMGGGFIVGSPLCIACSWAARKRGSELGSAMAKHAVSYFMLPFLVGSLGLMFVCFVTGVELGE